MSSATQERPAAELLPKQSPTTLAINFEATKEQLTQLVATSGTLKVKDIDDKAGIAKVRERRIELKNLRGGIEKRRKELKAESLEFGRKVDGVAKELTAIIEPEEKRLEYEENIVKRHEAKLAEEKARREKEAEEKKQAITRDRLNALAACGKVYMADDVAELSGEDFGQLLASEQADKAKRDEQTAADKAEQERVAAEQRVEADRLAKERAKLEQEREIAELRRKRAEARAWMLLDQGHKHELTADQLADMTAEDWEQLIETARRNKAERDRAAAEEKARLDRQREEQEAKQREIVAEHRRIHESRNATLRALEFPGQHFQLDEQIGAAAYGELLRFAKELRAEYDAKVEREKADAAEKARLDAIAEQERKDAEAKAEAAAAEAELARLESLRPDREKLLTVAAVLEAIEVPDVGESAKPARKQIVDALRYAARDVRGICEELITQK